jgi:23S rRNA (adenine-N6)-dimethyltransferase
MAHRSTSQIWSQHFFRDPARAASVVAHLPLTRHDTVYEIGPGTGHLTAPLAERAGCVVAVEVDPALCAHLRARFAAFPHVRIVHADFLTYPLPTHPYIVVANVPFAITAAVVTKLLDAPRPPRAAYLIVQREAAARFAGSPCETQYSVLAKPWFTLAATETFPRTAFTPAPRVDAAMLEIHQRAGPLVAPEDADLYRAFVRYGFGWWRRSLKTSFRPVFSNLQFRRLAEAYHFSLDATPTQLTFGQWLGLFRGFRAHVPPYKQQALVARVREDRAPVSGRQRGPIALPLPRPPPRTVAILLDYIARLLSGITERATVFEHNVCRDDVR